MIQAFRKNANFICFLNRMEDMLIAEKKHEWQVSHSAVHSYLARGKSLKKHKKDRY